MDGVTLPAAGADVGDKIAVVVADSATFVANIAVFFANNADVVADSAIFVGNTGVVPVATATVGVVFEQVAAATVPLFETASITRELFRGGLFNFNEERIAVMARKIVSVKQPKNIEDAVALVEKILLRNDGALPVVPASTIYITLGALVGVNVPAVSGGSAGTTPPAPPGTRKLPEVEIAAPLRTMYPSLKRNFLDYVAVKQLFATATNGLQTQLGFADGQGVTTAGTARNLINRAMKTLLGLFAGNENELETYGFAVTVGTGGGSTPPPAPTPP